MRIPIRQDLYSVLFSPMEGEQEVSMGFQLNKKRWKMRTKSTGMTELSISNSTYLTN